MIGPKELFGVHQHDVMLWRRKGAVAKSVIV